ncbi:hypothetical protein Pr1d_26980 [Bythopirellula goksoeyrii]|uniref:Uncharacterized protein n=1 Tax=Bythopirellula goksoeyrii TaxID=1400387 RepID=A0A5B9QCQ1_9BACT|nr:hypothetical protein Pr1d_26980 [Bythopirellula goksoeyrii]
MTIRFASGSIECNCRTPSATWNKEAEGVLTLPLAGGSRAIERGGIAALEKHGSS